MARKKGTAIKGDLLREMTRDLERGIAPSRIATTFGLDQSTVYQYRNFMLHKEVPSTTIVRRMRDAGVLAAYRTQRQAAQTGRVVTIRGSKYFIVRREDLALYGHGWGVDTVEEVNRILEQEPAEDLVVIKGAELPLHRTVMVRDE